MKKFYIYYIYIIYNKEKVILELKIKQYGVIIYCDELYLIIERKKISYLKHKKKDSYIKK